MTTYLPHPTKPLRGHPHPRWRPKATRFLACAVATVLSLASSAVLTQPATASGLPVLAAVVPSVPAFPWDTPAILPPSSVRASAITTTSITLAWATAAMATKYRVNGTGPAGVLTEVSTSRTSVTLTGLRPGSAYSLWVTSADLFDRRSAASPVVAVVTLVGAPTSVSASVSGDGAVSVEWRPAAGASRYTVRAVSASRTLLAAPVSTTSNRAVLHDVPAGSVVLEVRAVDPRTGAQSAPATTTVKVPVLPPAAPRVTRRRARSAKIVWKSVAQASGYRVRVLGGTKTRTYRSRGTSLTIRSLHPRTAYLVEVSTTTSAGSSSPSTLLFTTPARDEVPVKVRVRARWSAHGVTTAVSLAVSGRAFTSRTVPATVAVDPEGPARSTGKTVTRKVTLHRSRSGKSYRSSVTVRTRTTVRVRVSGPHLTTRRITAPRPSR